MTNLKITDPSWERAWDTEDYEGTVRNYVASFVTDENTRSKVYELCKRLHNNGYKAGERTAKGKIISALGLWGVNFK